MTQETLTSLAGDFEFPAPPVGPTPRDIATQIRLPMRLPPNHRGEPLEHLSLSAINRFALCPDDYRRWYLRGERSSPTGSMFLGSRLDDALTAYMRSRIAGSGPLDPGQVKDAYNEAWKTELVEQQQKYGRILWDEGQDEASAFALGLEAIDETLNRVVPRLGRPLHCQRRFEFRLAPNLRWSVIGYVDLDTIREQRVFITETGEQYAIQDAGEAEPTVELPYLETPVEQRTPVKRGRQTLAPDEAIELHQRQWDTYRAELDAWTTAGDPEAPAPKEPAPLPAVATPISQLAASSEEREVIGITDYKLKNNPIYQHKADRDPQATLYLAEKALIARNPVFDFSFAQVAKPAEGKRQNIASAVVRTRRNESQMWGVLARIAAVAAHITALYETLGPDRPWGFAEPGSWKCEPNAMGTAGRYCPHWRSCPMGAGL